VCALQWGPSGGWRQRIHNPRSRHASRWLTHQGCCAARSRRRKGSKIKARTGNLIRLIRSYESRRGTRAPHICMAGLCYDRQPIEAMSFVVTIPDKTPYTVSYDFYQEKLPYKPLAERFRRKKSPSIGIYPGKKSGYTVVRCCACSCEGRRDHGPGFPMSY